MPLGVLRLVGLPLVPVVLQGVLLLRGHGRVLGGRILLIGVAGPRAPRRRLSAAIRVEACARSGGCGGGGVIVLGSCSRSSSPCRLLAGGCSSRGGPVRGGRWGRGVGQWRRHRRLRRGCAHRSHCGGGRLPMAPHSAVSSSLLLSRSCRITRAIRCTAFSLSPAKKVVHFCLIQALLEICLQTGRKKNSLRHFWLEN